jgi:hypothetical protein
VGGGGEEAGKRDPFPSLEISVLELGVRPVKDERRDSTGIERHNACREGEDED